MRSKLLAAIVAGGVVAGGAGTAAALAANGASAAPAAAVTVSTSVPRAGGPLARLAAEGKISQAQARAIQAAMHRYMMGHWRDFTRDATPPMLDPDGPLAKVLPQLVKDRTITQAQADAIRAAFASQARTGRGWNCPGWNGAGTGRGPGMMGGGPGMMGGQWRAGPVA